MAVVAQDLIRRAAIAIRLRVEKLLQFHDLRREMVAMRDLRRDWIGVRLVGGGAVVARLISGGSFGNPQRRAVRRELGTQRVFEQLGERTTALPSPLFGGDEQVVGKAHGGSLHMSMICQRHIYVKVNALVSSCRVLVQCDGVRNALINACYGEGEERRLPRQQFLTP